MDADGAKKYHNIRRMSQHDLPLLGTDTIFHYVVTTGPVYNKSAVHYSALVKKNGISTGETCIFLGLQDHTKALLFALSSPLYKTSDTSSSHRLSSLRTTSGSS